MSKITSAMAALGVVAGLGVTALPLSSYAATSTMVPVRATVDSSLSITVSADEVYVANVVPGGAIAYEDLIVTVKASKANGGYNLSIKDSDGVTALVNGTDGIPALTAGSSLTTGTSGWGYAVVSASGSVGDYAGVTTTDKNIPDVGSSSMTAGASSNTVLRFGVVASTDQAPGTYTGGVVLTATAKPQS